MAGSSFSPSLADHPRIRGEHGHVLGRARVRLRIIPAYAGSTPASPPASATRRDHPRIRGEHRKLAARGGEKVGSSPHTRGARHQNRRRPERTGIIPAYAGSTRALLPVPQGVADHPRIRGEHVTPLPGETLACGSSPHTRGAQGLTNELLASARIIPAYAGSTAEMEARPGRGSGSSPHTRGAPE